MPLGKAAFRLRRYWIMAGGVLAFFLLVFFLTQAAEIHFLDDPTDWFKDHSMTTAGLGVLLLIGDVVLPVPSSVIMVTHGALFGVWLGGLLSLIGSIGATLTGFAIGRAGNKVIKRFVTPCEYERAARILQRWRIMSIVISRPVPLLAETVSILVGASPLKWSAALLASLVGSLPPAALYAVAGVTAASYLNGLVVFLLVMIIACIVWRIR